MIGKSCQESSRPIISNRFVHIRSHKKERFVMSSKAIQSQKYTGGHVNGLEAVAEFAGAVYGADNPTAQAAIKGNSDISREAMRPHQSRIEQIDRELSDPNTEESVKVGLREERRMHESKIDDMARSTMSANRKIHRDDSRNKTVYVSVVTVCLVGAYITAKIL